LILTPVPCIAPRDREELRSLSRPHSHGRNNQQDYSYLSYPFQASYHANTNLRRTPTMSRVLRHLLWSWSPRIATRFKVKSACNALSVRVPWHENMQLCL